MHSITASLAPRTGFHPTLHLAVPRVVAPADSPCALFAYVAVPPSFILDRYQLRQLHLEGKLGVHGGALEVYGDADLEGSTRRAGTAAALVQLAMPVTASEPLEIDVPVHMRYQAPRVARTGGSNGEGTVRVELGEPKVFWACPKREPLESSVPPCAPTSLFSEFDLSPLVNSTLHFVHPSTACPTGDIIRASRYSELAIDLPTGFASDADFVGPITVSAVWIGLVWLAWTAYTVWKQIPEGGIDKKRQ
ncbi:hypothetical protein JCM10212_006016 [Sporobolomyces blumeae]